MDFERLAKVLALAASDTESEALNALRLARRLLAAAGMDFVHVAARLTAPPAPPPAPELRHLVELEELVAQLTRDIRFLTEENHRLRRNDEVMCLKEVVGELREALDREEGERDTLEAEIIRLMAVLAGQQSDAAAPPAEPRIPDPTAANDTAPLTSRPVRARGAAGRRGQSNGQYSLLF